MSIRIGINGFGRIGKLVFRLMMQNDNFEVVGINDTADTNTLAHLLRYDSAHGPFLGTVEVQGENLIVNDKRISIYHENLPVNIPRTMRGTDIVIESSGMFLTHELLAGHLESGAKKVILTCPPQNTLDKTIIIGINENTLTENDRIISNASCTANSVAPMLKVLHEKFGIVQAFMNTVHPATNNQRLIDAPHKDLRRSRTALTNIIPTTSTAIPIVIELMPFLKDKFNGLATRVPIEDGSLIEVTAQLNSQVTAEEINKAFYDASVSTLKNIVQYCSDPIVSSDVIGNPHSLIFDSLLTKVLSGNFVQVIGWYDNEYAYSNRVVELAKLIS
jgi:glyceraldehyde 3-phosphate dehydrogenase